MAANLRTEAIVALANDRLPQEVKTLIHQAYALRVRNEGALCIQRYWRGFYERTIEMEGLASWFLCQVANVLIAKYPSCPEPTTSQHTPIRHREFHAIVHMGTIYWKEFSLNPLCQHAIEDYCKQVDPTVIFATHTQCRMAPLLPKTLRQYVLERQEVFDEVGEPMWNYVMIGYRCRPVAFEGGQPHVAMKNRCLVWGHDHRSPI